MLGLEAVASFISMAEADSLAGRGCRAAVSKSVLNARLVDLTCEYMRSTTGSLVLSGTASEM